MGEVIPTGIWTAVISGLLGTLTALLVVRHQVRAKLAAAQEQGSSVVEVRQIGHTEYLMQQYREDREHDRLMIGELRDQLDALKVRVGRYEQYIQAVDEDVADLARLMRDFAEHEDAESLEKAARVLEQMVQRRESRLRGNGVAGEAGADSA